MYHPTANIEKEKTAAISNGCYAEWVNFCSEDLFSEPPQIVDGHLEVPARPGHGMALNPDAVKRYRVA